MHKQIALLCEEYRKEIRVKKYKLKVKQELVVRKIQWNEY